MKPKIIILLLFAIILGLGAYYFITQKFAIDVPPVPIQLEVHKAKPLDKLSKTKDDFADSILLKVPFTPQAPTANWDELHNEACEEASAIMVDAYFKGMTESTLDPKYVENEIDKLTKWQLDNFGYNLDIASNETAEMIEKVYGLKTEIIKNFSEDDIKSALNKNYLVVISFNGRLLGNPNYKQPGPIHHMLVVKGYNKTGIVTNDPGTKRGLNYSYDFSTLYNAAGDWDHSQKNIDTNIKIAIIIKPN